MSRIINEKIEDEKKISFLIPLIFYKKSEIEYELKDINFNPDEMILHYITYCDSSVNFQNSTILLLNSNLPILEKSLIAIPNNQNYSNIVMTNINFKLNGNIDKNIGFLLSNLDGIYSIDEIDSLNFSIVLYITFIKHRGKLINIKK